MNTQSLSGIVYVTRERDDLGRIVYSAHWEPEDERAQDVTGPRCRDVEEAIAWGRDRAETVLVRLGPFEEGVYSAGERRATREIEELGGTDLRPFAEWPPVMAEVLDTSRHGDALHVLVHVPEAARLSEPIAPAGLYWEDEPAREALPLHKHVAADLDEGTLTFQTHGFDAREQLGDWYVLRSWWTPDQLVLAGDTRVAWSRERVPEGSDEVPCALSWEILVAGDEGYRAGNTWLTVETYERIIRDDLLRIRRRRLE